MSNQKLGRREERQPLKPATAVSTVLTREDVSLEPTSRSYLNLINSKPKIGCTWSPNYDKIIVPQEKRVYPDLRSGDDVGKGGRNPNYGRRVLSRVRKLVSPKFVIRQTMKLKRIESFDESDVMSHVDSLDLLRSSNNEWIEPLVSVKPTHRKTMEWKITPNSLAFHRSHHDTLVSNLSDDDFVMQELATTITINKVPFYVDTFVGLRDRDVKIVYYHNDVAVLYNAKHGKWHPMGVFTIDTTGHVCIDSYQTHYGQFVDEYDRVTWVEDDRCVPMWIAHEFSSSDCVVSYIAKKSRPYRKRFGSRSVLATYEDLSGDVPEVPPVKSTPKFSIEAEMYKFVIQYTKDMTLGPHTEIIMLVARVCQAMYLIMNARDTTTCFWTIVHYIDFFMVLYLKDDVNYDITFIKDTMLSSFKTMLDPNDEKKPDFVPTCHGWSYDDPSVESVPFVETVVDDQAGSTDVFMRFQSLLTGPLLGHLDTLACFMVTLGIVQPKCIRIKPFEDYRLQCRAKTTSACSFIEKVVVAAEYLVTTGYSCFATRSFDPIFGTSNVLTGVQNDHAHLRNSIDLILNGTYEQITKKSCWEYDQELAHLERKINLLKMNVDNSSSDTTMLANMSASVANLQQRILAHKQSMGTRHEPFAVKLFGGSSVGKSVITEHIVKAVLGANGISAEPQHIITIDQSDRFDSNFKGDATCYIADDLANAYADFEVTNSSDLVIRMVNSVQTMAIMPEAQDKGRVPIQPFLFIATTNRINLNAIETSTTPESVLRRFHVHATVKVHPLYATSTGMLDKQKINLAPKFGGIMSDLHLIDVTSPDYTSRNLQHFPITTPAWFSPHWTYPTMTGLNLKQFILYCCEASKRHKQAEDDRMRLRDTIKADIKCLKCLCPGWVCSCVKDQTGLIEQRYVTQLGYFCNYFAGYVYDTARLGVNTFFANLLPTPYEYKMLESLDRIDIISRYLGLNCNIGYKLNWWDCVPSIIVKDNPWFDWAYNVIERRTPAVKTLKMVRTTCCIMFGFILFPKEYRTIGFGKHNFTITRSMIAITTTCALLPFTKIVHAHNKRVVDTILRDRKISADEILDQAEMKHDDMLCKVLRYAAYATGVTGALIALRLALQVFNDQSLLSPDSDDEFEERATTPNMWFRPSTSSVEKGTSTPEDIVQIVAKNLMSMKYEPFPGKVMHSTCLILDNDHLLMNKHVWFYAMRNGEMKSDVTGDCRPEMEFEFVRGPNVTTGDMYRKTFKKSDVRASESSDFLIVANANNGARKSLFDYFVKLDELDAYTRSRAGKFVHRSLTGHKNSFNATVQCTTVSYPRANNQVTWRGFEVHTDHQWKSGDCGSVLISHTMPPRILGIHAIGIHSGFMLEGRAVCITLEDILVLMKRGFEVEPLEAIPTVYCGQVTDMARDVPKIHFIHQVDYSNRFDILGYKTNIASYATKVRPTEIGKLLEEAGHGSNEWRGPYMRFKSPWEPFKVFMDKAMSPMKDLPNDLLKIAQIDYVCGFMSHIREKKLTNVFNQCYPLTNHEILNGRTGVKYMEGMAMSTSCCFPFSGKKRDKLVDQIVNDDGVYIYVLKPEMLFLWDEMKLFEEALANKRECFFPFVSQQKDEIVPKIRKGEENKKVRVFQSSCLPLSFLMRKYFLPIVRLMSMFPLASECAVGINPYGVEFTEVFDHITQFGIDRIFDGDYSSWDQKVNSQLSETAFECLIMIAELCQDSTEVTYSDRDIVIMRTMKYAVTHAIIICHGAVLRFHGTNPSGQTVTTHLNSIMNSLLVRVSFYDSRPDMLTIPFRRSVAAITYGDDLVVNVQKDVHFNFSIMAAYLKRKNMDFTTGKKGDGEFSTFTQLGELTFLKRSFVYHPKIHCVLGALDIKSMYKCLYNWIKKNETEREVTTSNLLQFAQEMFAHGEEHYNLMLPKVNEVARSYGVFLPLLAETYNVRAKQWFDAYRPKENYGDYQRLAETRARNWTQIQSSPPEALYRFPWVGEPKELRPGNIIKFFKDWICPVSEPGDGFSGEISDVTDILDVEDQSAVVHIEQKSDTAQVYDRQGINFPSTSAEDVGIDKWLSRPTLIHTYLWTPNALSSAINPLDRFLTNPAIARKVANYRFISGVMHFKIVTTGTMAHWGRLIISHEPWPLSHKLTTPNFSPGSTTPSLRQAYQLQHIMIDPAAEVAGEMSAQILSPADNKAIIQEVGVGTCLVSRMYIQSLVPLRVLNGGNTSLLVQVYMYMTDVKLSGTFNPDIVQNITANLAVDQSAEYPSGVISTPATLAASLTEAIGTGLHIEPYTTPMANALHKTAAVASALGFSNPGVTETPSFMLKKTVAPYAITNGNRAIEKLAFDVNQSTAVDSMSAGIIESDPMLISSIAQRDWLTVATGWTPGSNSVLCTLAVTPQSFAIGVGLRTFVSPAAWVSAPFKLWRGTMRVRIEIVATPFHRGKLRVSYDPTYGFITNAVSLNPSHLNNAYHSHVIDITETRSYEFCVGWCTNKPWLVVPVLTETCTYSQADGIQPVPFPFPGTSNGAICVSVESDLVVGGSIPTSGSVEAAVLVYTRFEDDFCVAGPSPKIKTLEYIDQSADLGETPSSIRADHELLCLNQIPSERDEDNSIHLSTIGERLYSLRQIVKRPSLHSTYAYAKPTSPILASWVTCDFPVYRGIGVAKSFPSWAVTQGAKCNMTYLNWYARPFLGYRGAIRWHYTAHGEGGNGWPIPSTTSLSVSRLGTDLEYTQTLVNYTTSTTMPTLAASYLNTQGTLMSGAAMIGGDQNRSIEVEIPYQYAMRYKMTFGDKTSDQSILGDAYDDTWHRIDSLSTGVNSEKVFIFSHASAGDDFSLFFFRYTEDVYNAGSIVP